MAVVSSFFVKFGSVHKRAKRLFFHKSLILEYLIYLKNTAVDKTEEVGSITGHHDVYDRGFET